MSIFLEAFLFGAVSAPVILLVGCGIKKVLRHELKKLSPEELINLHRHQCGPRKHEQRLKDLE